MRADRAALRDFSKVKPERKSKIAALSAQEKPYPSGLFYSNVNFILNRFFKVWSRKYFCSEF